MVSENSMEAYRKLWPKLDTLRFRVYATVCETPGMTDEEIAKVLNTPLCSITGRLGELYKAKLVTFADATNSRNNRCRRSYPAGPVEKELRQMVLEVDT